MNNRKLILEHGCLDKLKDESLVVPFTCPVCSCRFDAEYSARKTTIEQFTGWRRFWYDGYPDHYRYVSKSRCPECDNYCVSYAEPREPHDKYIKEVQYE